MTYDRIRLAQEKQKLDRDTWGVHVKVPHNILARGVGEHLMIEPVEFGEAFEKPPLMTYSVTQLSGSVPTPVPRSYVKPSEALLATGCVNPVVLGSNILRDPGFEKHLTFGEGPNGLTFPGEEARPTNNPTYVFGSQPRLAYWFRYPELPSTVASDKYGWNVYTNINYNLPDDIWHISTVNPRSGEHHARLKITNYDSDSFSTINKFYWPVMEMYAVGVTDCDTKQLFSGRVDPGNVISWDAHIAITRTLGTPTVIMYTAIWDKDFNLLANADGSSPVLLTTGGYKKYSDSIVAPAGSKWFSSYIYMYFDSTITANGSYIIDIDDCTLGVS